MIFRSFVKFSLILSVAVALTACMDNNGPEPYDPYAQLEKDITTIDNYLTTNGITNVVKDPRGVRMVINGQLGTGVTALLTNRVKVAYAGRVLGSSTNFQSATATGNELRGYIPGWQIALTTLPVGTNATVYIPSPLAYQDEPKGEIPANSILVFDLSFQDIEETDTELQRLKGDTTAIDAYLTSKSIQATNGGRGLRYVITQEGQGNPPGLYNKITAKITYKLVSNDTKEVMVQNIDPATSTYSRLVDNVNGLQMGMQKMKIGSKATFYVPSGLGYGPYPVNDNSGAQVIPANSNLIIDVELTNVQ